MSQEIITRPNGQVATPLAAIPDEVAERFPVLDPEQQAEIMDLLAENLNDGETLSISNLTRVGNPQGKSLAFTVPDPAKPGKTTVTGQISGIVLAWQEGRTYYQSVEVSDSPPDCSSRDNAHGFGEYGEGSEENPTGLCEHCPMGQWTRGGNGQDDVPPPCKPLTNLLLLPEGEMLPWLVRVPRTSMNEFVKFRKSLIKYGTSLARSITKIEIEETKNDEGTKYGKLIFSMEEKLSDDRQASKAIAATATAFGSQMKEIIVAPPRGGAPAIEGGTVIGTADKAGMPGSVEDEGGVSIGDFGDEDFAGADETSTTAAP